MTPLPRIALLRLGLASVLLASFAPFALACDPPGNFARCLREIETEDSLATANSLLASQSIQADWRSEDPEGYRRAFAAATQLKDIGELLLGLSQPRAIRLGLEKRQACKFCNDPARLEAWFLKEMPWADKSRVNALREATWAWEFIPRAAQSYLLDKSVSTHDWAALDFPARMNHLQQWAGGELTAILATTPRTPAELKALEDRAGAISGIVGNSDSHRLWERVNHARQGVSGLERAAKLVGRDPAKRKALEDARSADLDGMLAGLGAIFDGAGVNDPAFRSAAPPTAEQTFDEPRRQRIAGLLATRFMKETEGTYAGADLAAFYGEPRTPYNALDLRVAAPLPGQENWIAWHSEGVITFNEKHIVEYLKVQGRSIDQLATDDALLGRLARQLTPLFIHEATHQVQYAWRRENNHPWLGGQVLELETMQTEALFVVQKSRSDPAYKAELERESKSGGSSLARESVSKAERLVRGTGYFRDTINAWHYPELLSLEGTAWCRIEWHNTMARDAKAELERRKTLSADAQKAFEAGPAIPERTATQEEWLKAVVAAGTPHLRTYAQSHDTGIEGVPAAYAAYRARLERINALTEERLAAVMRVMPGNKAKAGRREPPAPGR